MKAQANYLLGQSQPEPRTGSFGQLKVQIAGRLRLGLYSRIARYGLRRDLDRPLEKPKAKIPIAVRPLVAADLSSLLSIDPARHDHNERLEIARRRAFAEKVGNGCFVAVDLRDDTPCYMQWLIGSADKTLIQRLGGFPELEPDEALLENAYTPVTHRGLGIMSAAMALIAERAANLGARHVLTFVEQQNIASLKGCQRAGFYPHMLHDQAQMAFGLIRRNDFQTLSEDDERRNLRF